MKQVVMVVAVLLMICCAVSAEATPKGSSIIEQGTYLDFDCNWGCLGIERHAGDLGVVWEHWYVDQSMGIDHASRAVLEYRLEIEDAESEVLAIYLEFGDPATLYLEFYEGIEFLYSMTIHPKTISGDGKVLWFNEKSGFGKKVFALYEAAGIAREDVGIPYTSRPEDEE